ncbi:acyltransferase [Paraburkholderia sp. BL27I4N3]|uniref:acyltransferase family protein n=1 Tax=Paraburkholderia sp. BL27I4N3 TaxID=1938805 RepID=UPI000E23C4E1|nr:acyltransferase [Paraburkholderia sp. BL27I4N3]
MLSTLGKQMRRIPVLNGLRGMAIIAVVFHHSFSAFFNAAGSVTLTPLTVLGSSGWLGVNLFFFLSGFVLYLPYATGQRSFAGRRSLIGFYGHRARRLLPVYYTSALILLLFTTQYQLDDSSLYRALVQYALATFVFSRETFFPSINWALWSLGVELWFSLLFPAVVIAIGRFGWRKVLVIALITALCVRFAGQLIVPTNPRRVLNFISDSLFGRLDEFALGMLGAWLFSRRLMLWRPPLQLVCGVALLAASAVLWSLWYRGTFAEPLAALFNIPFDAGLLLTVNALVVGCKPVVRMVSIWPLQMSGLMCYSIYLWHAPIISHFRSSAFSVSTYVAYLSLTYLIAWFSYRYIEFGSVSDYRKLLPQSIEGTGDQKPLADRRQHSIADSGSTRDSG